MNAGIEMGEGESEDGVSTRSLDSGNATDAALHLKRSAFPDSIRERAGRSFASWQYICVFACLAVQVCVLARRRHQVRMSKKTTGFTPDWKISVSLELEGS
jgi:hypothetical protein